MRLRSALSSCAAILAVGAMSGTPASAQTATTCPPGGGTQYPPSACALAVSTSQARPGESIVVSGTGFAPTSTVSIALDAAVLSNTQTNPSGAFTTSVVIPSGTTPGTHTLVASGVDSAGRPRELTSTIAVLGVVTSRGGDALPRTGAASTVPTGVAGVALVAVGSVAVVAARRRRTAS